uniref:Gustatory receptor n=1 Tax=Strigamia maritima TaxID=126957 RepID=T1IP30_STRMM
MIRAIPKDIEEQSEFNDEYSHKFNRLWLRLFWLYGLELNNVEGNQLPMWRKRAIILLPRLLSVLIIVRQVILTIRLQRYEIFVLFFPATLFHGISIITVLVLHKREEKFSTLFKILSELTLKSSDNVKRTGRYIYIALFVNATFTAAYFICNCITITAYAHKFLATNLLMQTEFNYFLLRVYLFAETTFNTIFRQFFLYITLIYFSNICKLLSLASEALNYDMERAFVSKSELTNAKLNEFRRRYQDLTRLAEKISEIFSPILLVWLLSFILVFCLRIRSFKMFHELVVGLQFYYAIDACYLLFGIILIFQNSSQFHSQISNLKGKISQIMITNDDDKFGAFVNKECISTNCLLFSLSLIADNNVGINVSGLFLLSAFSFLTMVSTVMTYVILVYQS